MKIVFDQNDVSKVIGMVNKKSFLRVDAAQSGEKWGLPIFKNLKFKTEAEVWKDARVKKAAEKAKAFCNKKGWDIPTPDEVKNLQSTLWGALSVPDSIVKGCTAKINNPRIIKYNGLLLATCSCSFARRLASNRALGTAVGAIYGAAGTIPGMLIGGALGDLAATLFTKNKGYGLFGTFVAFKTDNDKIKWYQFGYFLVGDIKDFNNVVVENAKESLLSLEDLILGEGIGDAAEKTTVEGDVPDPKAPETLTDDEPEVVDVGGEMDPCNKEDGDYTCQIDDENAPMTPAEAEAAFESLLDPDYIDDSVYPFMV